jgi:hypothetical protein
MTITGDAGENLIGRTKGLDASLYTVGYRSMVASSSRVLRWTSRRSCFSVSEANQRWTRCPRHHRDATDQDGPCPWRCRRYWIVERMIGWLGSFRRLTVPTIG